MFRYLISLCAAVFAVTVCAGNALCDYGAGNPIAAGDAVKPGAVRAEVVKKASQLVGGPKAEGRIGDFKMANSRVAFVISGLRPASGMCPYGGEVEDAGIAEKSGGAQRWRNIAGDVCLLFYTGSDVLMGSRLFEPATADIVKDGSDGEAVVRFTGTDSEFPTRREFFLRPTKPMKLDITVDYILKPGSPALEIKITVANKGEKDRNLTTGMMFLFGDGANLFLPGPGFESGSFRGKSSDSAFAAGDGAGYGWYVEGGGFTVGEQMENLMITSTGKLKVPAGGSASASVYYIAAPGAVAEAQTEISKLRGDKNAGVVNGKCVVIGSGKPVAGAHVYAFSPDGKSVLSQATSAADGTFHFTLPAGEYVFRAMLRESDDPAPHSMGILAGKQHETMFGFKAPAEVEFRTADSKGKPMPAVAAFVPAAGEPPVPLYDKRLYNPFFYAKGYHKVAFTQSDGRATVAVKPGKYDVYVFRGMEYELFKKTLDLKPGQKAKVDAKLARSVDTAGYLCGDFHLHSGPSHETDDRREYSVAGYAAQGIEMAAATDHDKVQDPSPIVREQGVSSFLKTITGQEMTTKRMGHINVYPLEYRPDLPNGGAIDWMQKKIPDVIAEARNSSRKEKFVQINHPCIPMMGYLTSIAYDSATGKAADKENFCLDFDALEILNSNDYNSMELGIKAWASFMNRGKHVTITGDSDSHEAFRLDAGYPRNCVALGTDDPAKMDEAKLIRAMKEGKTVIDAGVFIRLRSGKAGPGGLVKADDGAAALNVEVYAPMWAEVSKLTVLQNGVAIKTIDLKPSKTALRYKGRIEVHSNSDAWYAVRADGDKPLFPVYPHARAFGMTNAIYVDVDGNGKFDAPMKSEETK